MKTQYRLIDVGKGIINITPSNLHKVESNNTTVTSNRLIVKIDELIIYKVLPNIDNSRLEIGDTVNGYVEGQFLSDATYYGGNYLLLSSYIAPII